MNILYAVPYMDIEYGWGGKPDGFKVFDSLVECQESTKKSSENGNYTGGYFGPQRPLSYYETNDEIVGPFPQFVDSIKFKTNVKYIK